MKTYLSKYFILITIMILMIAGNVFGQRQMEYLDRGLVAVKVPNGVFLSWRMLGTEWLGEGYNLYRGDTKLNSSPITGATNFTDVSGTSSSTYYIKSVLNGTEQVASKTVSVWPGFYKTINLQVPSGVKTPDGVTCSYSPNDCSVGDLNGDGEYEIILKWDPSNSKDNSQSGYTGNVYLDAYTLSGTFMWRIDLGVNIRAGAHYTQFLVYDFDGDGKSEIVCKTAPGTKDGTGNYLTGAAAGTNNSNDYRNSNGYILSGPEYLTIFNGQTGKELQTINYEVARGNVSSWGDSYGNRVDRFLACVAYLDGKTPSLVMCRGYYTRTYLVAYKWNGSSLTKQWSFDSNTSGYTGYAGQGNHNLSVADVDDDGYDEIIYGSCCIDHNGNGKWNSGLGHGDAIHVTDIDPSRTGLEVWGIHEGTGTPGSVLLDAKTGSVIWKTANADVGRGVAADLTTAAGVEVWGGTSDLRTCNNTSAGPTPSSSNFAIWWNGDDSRELLDGTKLDSYTSGRLVTLYNYETATACNGTKNTPNLQADIIGDFREEVILHSSDNSKLIIFTTTSTTNRKMYTLMHDKVYRLGIAWQNVAYNQPPHLSFFFGNGMGTPPTPDITLVGGNITCVATSIVPYLKVNDGAWQNVSSVNVTSGDKIVLGPQPTTGGSWSWSGLGTSGSSREQTIYPTSSGVANATYTNYCGTNSSKVFTITVEAGSNQDPCDNPVTISIPFTKNGAGEFCYVTSQAISYVNSWNMDLVEINGVDFTNKWSNSLPAAIDGKWYINYKASVAWAHFEAPAAKGAEEILTYEPPLEVYPNPVPKGIVDIKIPYAGLTTIKLYTLSGVEVLTEKVVDIQTVNLDLDISSGLYILKIENGINSQITKLVVE